MPAGAFPVFLRDLLLLKSQRCAIDAIPQSRRLWPIRENMPKVSPAGRALHLDPPHPKRVIFNRNNRIRRNRIPEARPSAPGLELLIRRKQRRITSPAVIHPVVMVIHQRPGKRPLRPTLTHYMKLLRSQQLAPLCLRLMNLLYFCRFGHYSNLLSSNQLDPQPPCKFHAPPLAITSISTSASFGNPAAATVDRAGATTPSGARYFA
jgi:hypothetical protein